VPKKVVLIGIDSLMPAFVDKFVREGRLPNLKRLMEEGVYAEALPSPPTLTSTNWTTIATGAEPTTHGVTDFLAHHSGEPLDKMADGFLSTYCQAEQIWVTAEKVGRQCIILDYPNSYPVNIKEGIHVGEHGLPSASLKQISFPTLYSTEEAGAPILRGYPEVAKIDLQPATDNWTKPFESRKPLLEALVAIVPPVTPVVKIILGKTPSSQGVKNLHLLVVDSLGAGYDRVLLFERKDKSGLVADLKVGQWSEWIVTDFEVDGESKEGAFRAKLLELSPTANLCKLYFSQVYPTQGWSYPEEVCQELVKHCGPFTPHAYHLFPVILGWIDKETYLEENDCQAKWFANASVYLLKNYDWDLFMLKWHSPDHVKHCYWGHIDPVSPGYDPAKAPEYWEVMARNYEMVDKMVGQIGEAVGEDAVVMVVSDHGHIAHVNSVYINNALAQAGLLTFKDDGSGVDWSKTRAYAQRSMHVYVNLKGRDPQGIVQPGAEYEEVQDSIIAALLDLKDPSTGQHAINLALKNEDAAWLGLSGPRAGDVIYTMEAGYTSITTSSGDSTVFEKQARGDYPAWGVAESHHGQYLASVSFSIGSMKAILMAKGPGLKKGYRRARPISLRDVAPTISHLMGIPAPAQSEGAILMDILETDDLKQD
jgi:predicted AlkP superfamily phosphohydrolase/phosphomutase